MNNEKINLKPLSDRVLIKPHNPETKTASGLIIPDSAKGKPMKGQVVSIGNGKLGQEMTVQVGDTVLYDVNYATEIKHNGDSFLILKESDIFLIIK
jgi:chaperonin GroES